MAITTVNWDEAPPASCQRGTVAIGNFDGVHRGHAAMVAGVRALAQAVGGPAVVLTFDPHPLQLLRPEHFQPVLTTIGDRAAVLESVGADQVVIVRTTAELLQLSAEAFFREVIERRLRARAIAEGRNFRFGHNREGNTDTLARLCEGAGLAFRIVPPLEVDGARVSSSRVRGVLVTGDVHAAASLLGRPYHLWGTVGTGQRRGRLLGFPTANLDQVQTLIPGDGVYAVRILHDAQHFAGAANIGPNPTFGEQARKVEVHLIGFSGDLLGQSLKVEFVERLRDTQRFEGPDQLVQQLRADVEQARRLIRINP